MTGFLLLNSPVLGQDEANEEADFLAELDAAAQWERNGTGKIDKMATIQIPQGYRFTGEEGTEEILVIAAIAGIFKWFKRMFTGRSE